MARPFLVFVATFALYVAVSSSAWAQFQQPQQGFGGATTAAPSGATSQSMFGTRTQGSGIQSLGSASTFGNQGQNSGAFTQGSTMGGNTMGGTGGQGGGGDSQFAGAGVQGNERYTRQGRQPGAFVGADSGDTTNLFSAQQGTGLGGMQGLQGLQGLGGNNQLGNLQSQFGSQQNQFGNQNQNFNNNRPKVRTGLRVAPELKMEVAARVTSPAAVARVQTRLANTPQFQRLGSVSFAVEGQTAILRGKVATAHARDLAARVALLEPGISAVQNDLIVDSAESTPPASN